MYLLFITTLVLVCSNVHSTDQGSLSVQVDGTTFHDFKGFFENGILTLYRGEDPTWNYDRKISFWHMPSDYDGKTVAYPDTKKTFQNGQMSYDKKDPKVNLNIVWLKKFEYTLEFGKEADYKIPVTITSSVTSPNKINIKGKLSVATAGIKMKDGIIDRSFDHLDSIKWLTKDWIKSNKAALVIQDKVETCFMEKVNKSKKKAKKPHRLVAACSFRFTDKTNQSHIAKIWLEKINNQWQVAKAIKEDQLFGAHPIKPPFRNKTPYIFKKISAVEFENTIYQPNGGYKHISEPGLWPCGGGQVGDQPGWCELPYKVYKTDKKFDCQYVTYIFNKNKEGNWIITQTLGSDQMYDHRKQLIKPREDRNIGFC